MDSIGLFAMLTGAACLLRVKTPLRNIDRDLWSFVCRVCSVTWFLSIWWRSAQQCNEHGWQPLHTPGADPFSVVVKNLGVNQCMPADIAYFPVAQIIYYVSEIAWIASQPRDALRRDEGLMVTHHLVTTLLIAFWGVHHRCYWLSTFLPTLHDINDVFIDSAKYLKRRGDVASPLIDTCFALFVVSWLCTRVYYIPTQLLPQIWNDPDGPPIAMAYYGFSLLVALQFAQAYWTVLIGRAVWRATVSGKLEDERD